MVLGGKILPDNVKSTFKQPCKFVDRRHRPSLSQPEVSGYCVKEWSKKIQDRREDCLVLLLIYSREPEDARIVVELVKQLIGEMEEQASNN